MTLPMADHSMSWDRTLPKPAALLPTISHDPFASSRGSSLLQHHIISDKFSRDLIDSTGRRSTVPCIAYQQRPGSPHHLEPALDPRITAIGNGTVPEHMTRKRSASHMADDNHSSEPSPSSPSAGEVSGQFCLCQPDPKIPRPRNAFILYRQHQQASVVAQNPGLPNPDISKIIGEQWRSLPVKTKSEWKALAEEEKARHQQLYPDYRYQPRRNGRYSNQSSISGPTNTVPVGPEGNCLKCGGKMMNPPGTPYTPYTPVTPGLPQMVALPPPRRHYTLTAPQNGRSQVAQPLMSPKSARVRPYAEVFGRPAAVDHRHRYTLQQPPTPMMLDSPDPKRRRFNGNSVFVPAPGQIYADQSYQYSPRVTSGHRPEAVQPRATMAPPSRNAYIQAPPAQHHPVHPQAKCDPSLTLPPLKTTTTDQITGQSQKSALEAMIMSIPVLNKIKILSQISSHLAAPGLGTPPPEIRGSIIAVEGMDPASVYSMTDSLAEQLEKDGQFAVRIFGGPDPYESAREGAETMTTETFLKVISEWHVISREIVHYITTRPGSHDDIEVDSRKNSVQRLGPEPGVAHERQLTTGTTGANAVEMEVPAQIQEVSAAVAPAEPDSAVSPKTMTQTAGLSLASPMPNSMSRTELPRTPTPSTSRRPSASTITVSPLPQPQLPSSPITQTRHQPSTRPTQSSTIPIAIVPHYQLTTVDASSIAMPIIDAYSPLSHWQWLATLWRGCVGPDVTVVIKSTESEAEVGEKEKVQPGVEVRLLDCKSIIVRSSIAVRTNVIEGKVGCVLNETGAGTDGGDENWEKAKRRVGFEVEEVLRN